jgi:hypothetical protein
MKVYLVGDYGPEHDSLEGIYKDKKKALQVFQEHRLTLLKNAQRGLQYSKDNAKEYLQKREESEYWKKIAEEGDEMYLCMIKNLQEEDPVKIDNYPHETPYLKEMEVIE